MNYRPRFTPLWLTLAVTIFAGGEIRAQGLPDYERPPVNYSQATPRDGVARLLQRVATKEVTFSGPDNEILRQVLRELEVPVESQVVVFSRTSLQAQLILPATPRAIYFSDSAYVGFVPDGLIEVAAVDPELGPVFYGFDPQDARDGRRTFVRESSCLRCHGGTFVRDIPGLLARSLHTAKDGEPLLRHGSEIVDDQTPFERLWGGWYVTGYAGSTPHRGNTFGLERGDQLVFTPDDRRPTELSEYFNPSRYLAATSDVVALLVFQHQLAMHNSLTRAAHGYRRVLANQRAMQHAFKEPETDEPTYESTRSALAYAADDVLDHLLFRHAAPLPGGVTGGEAFRRAFATGARRDSRGHALKDLSLDGRLFANRCSFLIYSESFAALPAALKDRILDRLRTVLREDDPQGRYAYLESAEKRRILGILVETHPDARRRFLADPN